MSHDIKTAEPKVKEGEGFLRRLLNRIDPSAGDAHSGSAGKSTLDLGDIQGIILRGYRMPMVRHFLLSVGVPAAARKMLGRLVSGDAAVEVDVLYTDKQVAIGGKYLITAQDCSASCLRQR